MYLTSEKSEIFAKHGGNAANTGSAEGKLFYLLLESTTFQVT